MRRLNGIAALGRAMEGGAATSAGTQHRLLLAKLYNTSSSNKQCWFSNRFSDFGGLSALSIARGVSGTKFFSVAATSLAQEAHVKEPSLSEKFLPKEVVLYQYQACPFCNKVKAFLDYNSVPYKVVEVNPISKKEIEWSDCKKVPILTIDGEQMVDSSGIIDMLYSKIHPENSSTNSDEERKWREWVDNHLVHVLSPNIYRSTSEALESFDYITTRGDFSFTERIVAKYAGAAVMYFAAKKIKKEHNITDERISLYEAAKTWVDALQGRQFLGGFEPNLADLAVFGVLRPIRYLQSGKDMVENTCIGEWYGRMENAMGEGPRMMEYFLTNGNTLLINSSNEMGTNVRIREWYGRMENAMGAGSRKMESMLSTRTESEIIVIKPVKVRSIYFSASMVAQEIALRVKKLKKRSFRSIFIHFAHDIPLVMKKRVIGLRISCSGRLRGRAIATTYCGKYGKTSLVVLDQRIDYAFKKVPTRYGILGVKVWISYRKKI